eukprot:jgi/Botrbrau1/8240/Bobra.0392s0035.1
MRCPAFLVDVCCIVRPVHSQLAGLSYRCARHVTRPFNVVSRAASTASEARPYARRQSRNSGLRVEEFRELLQEILQIAASTGPRGFFRSVQAGGAVLEVGRDYMVQLRQGVRESPEVVLRKLFERLGATYIKLGQFIASSPTLFPEEYVLEFSKCLDRTDPIPWQQIRSTLQQELQRPLDEIFSSLDPVPLASASIAQVHAGVLRDSNKEIVVKVLKPGVEDILSTDLSFIYVVSLLLEFLNPELARTSLVPIIGDIRASMLEEVDFRKEAVNMQQFSRYLDASGMRGVATCPFVYTQWSTQRVLTMERLTGVERLTDLEAVRRVTGSDPESVLINALNTWFGSLLACDSFHADLHAGNLLAMPDGRVGFIDFGIVGRISPITWRAVEALLTSMSSRDYDTMARALVTVGAADSAVDIPAFARDLEAIFTDLDGLSAQLTVSRDGDDAGVSASIAFDDSQMNRLILQIVRVADVRGIRFPREFGLLLKQLLYFDRYTRILAPEMSVLARPEDQHHPRRHDVLI